MSDPFIQQGEIDAMRGHTACPYGVESEVKRWHKGYTIAEKKGKAVYPRFAGRKRRGKNK